MKIKVPNKKRSSGKKLTACNPNKNRTALPSHTALVPDMEDEGRLTRVGVLKRFVSGKYKGRGFTLHIDDNPRAKQLAYENLERIVLLPIE